MKVEFIANASALITFADQRTLLTDPWYSEGIYYGSWYNFPPIAVDALARYQSLTPSYIYISHIHPDHLDRKTLTYYPKNTPVLIGKLGHNHLYRAIRNLGFEHVVQLPLDKIVEMDGLAFAIFSSFEGTGDGYIDETNYAMDTSLWVKDSDGQTIFHGVDNPIKVADAEKISKQLGCPDLAFLPYGGASFFPHAFTMYSADQKRHLTDRVKRSRLDHFCQIAKAMRPRLVVPAAGSYIMGGRIASYSEYLHQATPKEIIDASNQAALEGVRIHALTTGDVIDTVSGAVTLNSEAMYRDFSHEERTRYASTLQGELLHDKIRIPAGFDISFEKLLRKARASLWRQQSRMNLYPSADIKIIVRAEGKNEILEKDFEFSFSLDREEVEYEGASQSHGRSSMLFRIDASLMLMQLLGAANWNNLEIGALVECEREPDLHNPTLHSLMSFFVL